MKIECVINPKLKNCKNDSNERQINRLECNISFINYHILNGIKAFITLRNLNILESNVKEAKGAVNTTD